MFKLSLKRYGFILFFQLLFLCIDLSINSFSYLARGSKISIIFLFLSQDVCLILSFTALIYNLYSTHVYQAGLADFLYAKFRFPLIISMAYFLLCIALHTWLIVDHNKTPYSYQWPKSLTALFIIQKLFSPVYYFLYKRTALRMSDPRFFENLDWISEQLSIK